MTYTTEPKRFSKWITVQAYKHDGLLHRQWSPAYLALETEDFWALTSKASLVTECDGRRWMTKEPAVFFLFKKRWMNIIAMMKDNGGIVYYVNVASPTIMDNGFLKYIDYDLDVKLFPDGAIKVLDEQEFEKHIQTYVYSNELVRVIRNSFKSIQADMIQKKFPFNIPDVLNIFQKFLDENHPFQVRQ
ncbi:MAG: DUF402 domain-containing protein [Bacilli bacterium]|nr:DUF402 domain-containing protein [Bacilli bacterium]